VADTDRGLLEEFLEEWQKICSESEEDFSLENTGPSYPDYYTQKGGGTEEEIEQEVSRMLGCDRTALRFMGVVTGADYYKFISCMKWFCEKCGTHNGRIHKRRVAGLLGRVDGLLDTMALRQFIFTMPESWRLYFMSRKAISGFMRIAEKIINKKFPGKKSIAYFHAFGDEESKGKYHPHVNIHVIEEKATVLRLSPEELQDIKKALWRGLHSYILAVNPDFLERRFEDSPTMNVRYAFYQGRAKVLHKLTYMARLHPNYEDYRWVRKNPSLARLFIVDMKGFSYIRYFNGFNWQNQKDVDRKEEVKEAQSLAGEPLRYVKDGEIRRGEFDMKFREWDLEKLKDGFYRIRGSAKREKLKTDFIPFGEWPSDRPYPGGA
jgi:hypothetical protein